MRWIVGLLLVTAAVLKAVEMVVEPATMLTSPLGLWFLLAQVGAELALGLLVLGGLYWHRVRWVALVLFTSFAAYSLSLAIGGAASCGCFGPVKVHPWWTFSLDIAVVFGLASSICSRRGSSGAAYPPGRFFFASRQAIVVVIASVSILGAAILLRYAASRTVSADGLITTAGDLVILEPQNWVGKPLPIADSVDLDLSHGKWTVLLHRHDCPDCQAAVPRYEELAVHAPSHQIALVEVPPYGDSPDATDSICRHAQLSSDREWFVQTPVEIQLLDGVVTKASTELPALQTSTGG